MKTLYQCLALASVIGFFYAMLRHQPDFTMEDVRFALWMLAIRCGSLSDLKADKQTGGK